MEESKRGDCNGFQSLASEIVSEILARLPIEWIMRCKCVCKTWYALINDNYFSKLQLSIAKFRPSSSRVMFEPSSMSYDCTKLYLLDVEDRKVRKIPWHPLVDMNTFGTITQFACMYSNLDGLICLAPQGTLDPVVIYNPLIRGDYVVLPKSGISIDHSVSQRLILAFDASINKYKAVRMLNYFQRGSFEVLTIGEGTSWRRVVPPFVRLTQLLFSERGEVFHQGSIYWIVKIYGNEVTDNGKLNAYIVRFDVTKEIFRIINISHLMRACKNPCRYLKLQILQGSLALFEMDGRLLHIRRLVKQNGSLVVGYRKIKIESPYKYATISSLLCPYNTEDFLLLQTYGGYEPDRDKNGERVKTKGTKVFYYYPFSKKNDRFAYLSPQFPSPGEYYFRPWCFKPSLISIKAAYLSHM